VTGGRLPEGFWIALAVRLLHPVQLQIIEAMRWIDQPLSVSELVQVLDREQRLSAIAYHVGRLAKLGALRPTGHRHPARGSIERFYRLGLARK
jgi:predicted MarR family transcription regulator